MTHTPMAVVVSIAATLAAAACDKAIPAAEESRQEATPGSEARDKEAAELDRRLAALEREWQQVQDRLSKQTASASATVKAEIADDLMAARETVAELRTTTAENWWERQQRELERTAEKVEQNVRTFARRSTPPVETDDVAIAGDGDGWAARRDALVARMEKRIRAMEEALDSVDPREAKQLEVENARARVEQMKEDTERLRRASEAEWWDVTKERVNAYLNRLDAAIDRLAEGRS